MSKTSTLFVFTLALAAGFWLATFWILTAATPVVAALPLATLETAPLAALETAQAQQGTYVITFQAGVSPAGYDGATDATLNYFAPTDNLGGHTELVVRSDSWQRALLRFDLSQHIPLGVHVTSATLTFRVLGQSAPTSMRLVGYPVLQTWVEGQVTWDEAQSSVAWAGGGGCEGSSRSATAVGSASVDQPTGEVALDVTSAVQTWVDNAATNQGLLLKGEIVAGSVTYRFASSNNPTTEYRPKLQVTYEGAPPLATPTPTQTPTKTPTPSDSTMLTSTPADWNFDVCMKVDQELHVSPQEQMVLIWEGNPWAAELRLTVCNSDVAHPIFLNGVQVGTTPPFSTENCECNEEVPRGYAMSFPLDLALVRPGPAYSNVITISNEAAPWDSIKVYGARIIMQGHITGTTRSYFAVGTDFDGTPLQGAMQLPIGYTPSVPTPLLISVPGTGEDKDSALIRHMVGANEMGWLLASMDMRRARPSALAKAARSPSLAVQRDIVNLVQYVQANYNVDRSRIYIAGFSSGGGIAATVAAKYPDVFAGALDYAGPTDYAEWFYERADLYNELVGEFGGEPPNNFEYPRRSSRWLARNLRYVPMRIVHGTADDRVLSSQSSRLYYEAMPLFYAPASNFKELYEHAGGHSDHVAGVTETDLQFLSEHVLNENPQHLSIITDEAKDYYWLRVDKADTLPDAWRGWVEIDARYDPITSTIWVTARDGEFAEGKALTVTLDLSKMGLDTGLAYDIEEYDEKTGDFFFLAAVSAAGAKLVLPVPRNALGAVNRRYVIYPATGQPPTLLRLRQGLDGYTGAKDTYVTVYSSEGSADAHGSAERLLSAYDLRRKALLRFDLGPIPAGKEIKAAKLTVHLLETRSLSISLGAYEAKRPWLDTEATWERATQSQLWTAAGADGVGTDRSGAATYAVSNVAVAGPYSFDMKALVEQWIATPDSNFGLFLIGNGSYTSESYPFASAEYSDPGKRPVLEIWYMDPLPSPTVTPVASSTQTPTPTRTATIVQSTGTPTRTATPTPAHTPTPSQLFVATVATSTLSDCMEILSDGNTLQSAQARVLLMWSGTPSTASLVLTSCGVKTDRNHSVYLNGQPVAHVESDVFSACSCFGGGRTVTYAVSDPNLVISGWNYISITNDADLTDDWLAHSAQLVISGNLTASTIGEVSFVSSYDQTTRRALYQLPAGYSPTAAGQDSGVPLLVSIGGTYETKWDGVYRFAEEANARGWIILAPDIRSVTAAEQGRTASLEVQHDIIDAIDYLLAEPAFNVDPSRIYMSGFSVGGGIAAVVAAKYPHRFAAVVDWAGPTDLKEWAESRPEMQVKFPLIQDIGCAYDGGADPCPFEWTRRSAIAMTQNLKNVPLAVVHGLNDTRVPVTQTLNFIGKMREYFVPEDNNKLFVQHDGDHVDMLPSFSGLDFMADFALNANPSEIMIRADENKNYYWVRFVQKDWNGNWADGFSRIAASYDPATHVISATISDERGFRDGNLPVDVAFDLRAMGFDPFALYTIEDYNLTTGDFELRTGVVPVDGHVWVSLPRDRLDRVAHQYLIYPFAAPTLHTVMFQQGVAPAPTYAGANDTYIYQYQPSTNYAGALELKVNNGGSLASLLRFDISDIPADAVIKEAQLTLYLSNEPSEVLAVSLYAMNRPWVDTEANWTQAAQGVPWAVAGVGSAGVDYDPTPISTLSVQAKGFYAFNVKSLFEQWLTGVVPNHGLLAVGPRFGGSGSVHYNFGSAEALETSYRPKLEIAYMLPAAVSTPTTTPTPTSTRTATATPTATGTPQSCLLQGSVSLQRPGRPAPDPSWVVSLTVEIGETNYATTTDSEGHFTISGLAAGTYDIRVKNAHTLANVQSVSLVPGTNAVSFGTLREGDANNDNCITIIDFSLLAYGFFPAYDARADFNQDGYVNIQDFSMLRENFGLCGD